MNFSASAFIKVWGLGFSESFLVSISPPYVDGTSR